MIPSILPGGTSNELGWIITSFFVLAVTFRTTNVEDPAVADVERTKNNNNHIRYQTERGVYYFGIFKSLLLLFLFSLYLPFLNSEYIRMTSSLFVIIAVLIHFGDGFSLFPPPAIICGQRLQWRDMSHFSISAIESPFSGNGPASTDDRSAVGGENGDGIDDSGPLDLTEENVELVLDGMRPYLLQDGGNVKISSIDGPVVRLELVGECGTCPSSTQTMKMGLERGLKERIPEIQEVVQAVPEGPALEKAQVEIVLDSVRPFLSVAGGTIECVRITGEESLQPVVELDMQGAR